MRLNVRWADETFTPTIKHKPMDDTVRFEMNGATHEDRVRQHDENWRKAREAVKEGKPICISDLIGQAEQLYVERLDNPKPKPKRKPRGQLAKLLAQANTAADKYCALKAQGKHAEAEKVVDELVQSEPLEISPELKQACADARKILGL